VPPVPLVAGLRFVFVFFSLGAGMVSYVVDPPVPWFPIFAWLGFVSEQFVFSFSLGAGIVSLGAGIVSLGAGTVTLGAGIVSLGAGTVTLGAGIVSLGAGTVTLGAGIVSLGAGTVSLGAGIVTLVVVLLVQLVEGVVSLVAGMVVLLVLQEKRYTGIVNMISRHLWVWFVEVVLLEDVTLALLQLVPLMVSLVDPSGAGTVLFEETVVVF